MSIFQSKGFDTYIGKQTSLNGDVNFVGETVVDGIIVGRKIAHSDPKNKASLMINGTVEVETIVSSANIVVNGVATADDITVHGVLAIHRGAKVNAKRIFYKQLVIQTGARLEGQMICLDSPTKADPVAQPEETEAKV